MDGSGSRCGNAECSAGDAVLGLFEHSEETEESTVLEKEGDGGPVCSDGELLNSSLRQFYLSPYSRLLGTREYAPHWSYWKYGKIHS